MHPLVEVKNVGLVYHEPHAETQALKNLNMTVNEGEFVANNWSIGLWKDFASFLAVGLHKTIGGRSADKRKKHR